MWFQALMALTSNNIIQFQISMVRLVRVVGDEENKDGECLARSVERKITPFSREPIG